MDPVSGAVISTVTGEAAKVIVQKGIDKVTKRAQNIDDQISQSFQVLGREIRIRCPDALQTYSMSLKPKPTGLFHNKVRLKLGRVRRVDIRSVVGLQLINAITILEEGFEIDMRKLQVGEMYMLDVEYGIEDNRFLESLVSREVPNETPHEDAIEYWMVAQLKQPDALRSSYGRIDLKDVDFIVNVDIHKDIETRIPKQFQNRLDTIVGLTKPLGVDERFREWQKVRAMPVEAYGESDLDVLKRIFNLFDATRFRSFVEVTQDFHYFGSERGASIYNFPFPIWPKFMNVISRTDLGLEKPAAEGALVFKKSDMLKELERIFGSQNQKIGARRKKVPSTV